MSIILLEPPDPGQSSQSSRRFIPMQNTKVCHPNWELSVTPIPRSENQTMSWTIHRLESEFLLLDLELEHVVGVILPVTGGFPELRVVHVG